MNQQTELEKKVIEIMTQDDLDDTREQDIDKKIESILYLIQKEKEESYKKGYIARGIEYATN